MRTYLVLLREPLNWLLLAMPLAAVLEAQGASDLWVFIASAVAIVPLAGLMGRATESLSERLGPSVGALLNATFGNAAELIIAMVALSHGPEMYPLVKASITGSIIGNILLVLGGSMLAGGLRHSRQRFNRTATGNAAVMLVMACIGLTMPTLHYYLFQLSEATAPGGMHEVEMLSEEIAVILAIVYCLNLVFSLVTHRDMFRATVPVDEQGAIHSEAHEEPEFTIPAALVLLLIATAAVTWMSHLLVGSVEGAAATAGMNEVFVGVIIVAIIGNAAEHSTAVSAAWKGNMDLAVSIATGSSIQIALLVVPILVLFGALTGDGPTLDLHFTLMEIVVMLLSVGAASLVCLDGESNWLEGVMLLAVYAIMALAFFHLPPLLLPVRIHG
ncbi:MAG TPA: calcium/proton exchanger [Pirellulales bacterium]|jgi:Ca2+:H+ antiporter|nr:calcium/proton exchanger [Pirellulales bacterium]